MSQHFGSREEETVQPRGAQEDLLGCILAQSVGLTDELDFKIRRHMTH